VIADDLGQFINVDAVAKWSLADMALEDLFEPVAPLAATNPLHQPFHRMNCRHARLQCVQESTASGADFEDI
jgi:hypothetical protein